MWFDYSRKEGFPTQYAPNQTPVTADILEAGFIAAFIILAVSFLVSSPITNLYTNISVFLRVSVSLSIGLILILGNIGQEWEVGSIVTKTPYKAGNAEEIYAAIEIKIGLRSVNVTLKSDNHSLGNEIIDYNERFSWTWDQGRFGFGPFAGHLQQEFRAAQYQGVPLPILWVVDYFVIDGEGFRFGRFYRTAGWYSHILLWTAFACWLICLFLFKSVLRYGAYCLAYIGILQLLSNLLWCVIRNPNPLKIPFEDGVITTKFGGSFWLTFVSGILNIIIAIIIIIMDVKFDSQLYTFFGVDPFNSYVEVAYLTNEERMQLRYKSSKKPKNDLPLIEMNSDGEQSLDPQIDYVPVYIKRRYTGRQQVGPPVVRSNKPRHFLPAE